MKIIARIRQLLSAKENGVVREGVGIPLPIVETPVAAKNVPLLRAPHAPAPAAPLRRAVVIPVPSPVTPTRVSVRLEGEGIEHPIADPSTGIIRRELERLRSSGPSHLALVAKSGSYLQAAGNAKRMTVEGHLVSAKHTTHVVLGRQGSAPVATVVATFGPIEVRASEVWSALEATELFSAFSATGFLPTTAARRDISVDIDGLQRHKPGRDPLGESTP